MAHAAVASSVLPLQESDSIPCAFLSSNAGAILQGTAFTASVDALGGQRQASEHLTGGHYPHPGRPDHPTGRPGVSGQCSRFGHNQGGLQRRGHPEELSIRMRIAGREPGAVICEILGDDGEAARGQASLSCASNGTGRPSTSLLTRKKMRRRISKTQLHTRSDVPIVHYPDIETGRDYILFGPGHLREQQE